MITSINTRNRGNKDKKSEETETKTKQWREEKSKRHESAYVLNVQHFLCVFLFKPFYQCIASFN